MVVSFDLNSINNVILLQQGDVEHGEYQAVPQQGADGAHLRGMEKGKQTNIMYCSTQEQYFVN
jgi:hypothetical protein